MNRKSLKEMNKLLLTFLASIAVGLLIIPAAVVYFMPLLPYFIAFIVVMGALIYLKLKDKSAEDTNLKEMSEKLSNQLQEIQTQHDVQSKKISSIMEKLPQLLEMGIKKQEEVEGKLETLNDKFNQFIDVVSQASQTLQTEVKTVKEGMVAAVSGMDSHLNETVAAVRVAMENGQKSQLDQLRTFLSEIVNSVSKEIASMKGVLTDQTEVVSTKMEELKQETSISFDKVRTDIGENVKIAVESLENEAKQHREDLKVLSAEISSSVNGGISKCVSEIQSQNEMLEEHISGIRTEITNGLKYQLGIQEEIKNNVEATLSGTTRNQKDILESISQIQETQILFGDNIATQSSVVEETVAKVNENIQDSFDGFTNSLKKSNSELVEKLESLFRKMKEAMEELPEEFKDSFKSSVGQSIEEMGMTITNLQISVEDLNKFGDALTRYEEQLNALSKSETSAMNQFERIIRGK